MAFRSEKLNPAICDSLKKIFEKPATDWSKDELFIVLLNLEAIGITAKYCPHYEKLEKV